MTKFYIVDYELSADQLDHKYNPDGDGVHPKYTRRDWRHEVNSESTISGYWEWVAHMLDMERDELDQDNPHTHEYVTN